MKKDTLRLILFTDCNMSCSYCCNENPKFSSEFIQKKLSELDFSQYENFCITGGEPFLEPETVFKALDVIPKNAPVYIYTNGILLTNEILLRLRSYENIKALNIGLHGLNQLQFITKDAEVLFNVRFMMRDIYREDYIKRFHPRLTHENTKGWVLDVCDNRAGEDHVLLIKEDL